MEEEDILDANYLEGVLYILKEYITYIQFEPGRIERGHAKNFIQSMRPYKVWKINIFPITQLWQ